MSSELPTVAVLLAAYNGMSWIEEQLASVLAQTRVHVNVYISVDPSSDGTEDWCTRYADAHPNVYLLPPLGPFGGAARNFFRLVRDVDLECCDYVSFCDQDDIWYSDKLERAVAKLRSDRVDGYSSNVVAFWPDGRRMLVDKAQPQVKWDYLFEAAGPGCTYVLSATLARAFKRFLIVEWERVQDISLHDWFCYAFARSQGFRWIIDSAPGMDYRQHASNQVGVNAGVGSARARWRRIVNGWWFGQIQLTSSLLNIPSFTFLQVPVLTRFSILRLALMSPVLRRRLRDRVALTAICLIKAVIGA
ncbi:glycosyltransferase [Pseudomonas sp. Pseu.R1]|uniref:glycosyltransferase n=1 Tax=Pseudomonas sp. Pseu.R1 TaxID=3379818 RepID=UPI003B94E92A